MNFLNPFFLIGLLAVAIPIVIHLINLREPKKVYFSTLAFFNSLKKSTFRRIRIKQYLLMALRTMAVLLLALALARPFLPAGVGGAAGSGDTPRAIVLLMDNSPSMSRIGASGPLIDQGKEIANNIIAGAGNRDRFIVATTNGSVDMTALTGPARARELIGEVEPVNQGNYTTDVVRLLSRQLMQAPMREAVIYIISDGQKSQFAGLEKLRDDELAGDKPVSVQMVKLQQAGQQNLAVTSLSLRNHMLSPNSSFVLQAEVKNVGDVAASNQFVSLETEGRMAGQYQVMLEPGQSEEFLFEVSPSGKREVEGRIILEGDEVTYDNSRYFTVHIPEAHSVLLINEEENTEFQSYLKTALEASQQTNSQIDIETRPVSDANSVRWSDYDVVVLDGLPQVPEYWFDELQQFVQDGRGVLFLPSEQGSVQNYNAFLDQFNAGSFKGIRGEYGSFKTIEQVGEIVEGHPVLDELFVKQEDEQVQIDLPGLFFFLWYDGEGGVGSYKILQSETGVPLLAEQRFGDGKVLISAFGADPGWSNFPVNPLFAPLFYRSVLYAASMEQGGIEEHQLGRQFEWTGNLQSREVELMLNNEVVKPEVEGLPEGVRIQYSGREWEPGVMQIIAGNQKRRIAINQNIMESDFETLKDKELAKMLGNSLTVHNVIDADSLSKEDLEQKLNVAGYGEEIWNWLVWAALFFLIAETLVTRLYKAESIS